MSDIEDVLADLEEEERRFQLELESGKDGNISHGLNENLNNDKYDNLDVEMINSNENDNNNDNENINNSIDKNERNSSKYKHKYKYISEKKKSLKEQDYEKLVQAWITERTSPDLHDFLHDVVNRIMSRIRKQMQFIEDNSIKAEMDATNAINLEINQDEENGLHDDISVNQKKLKEKEESLSNIKFTLLIVETELERVKYLIRNYLRTRLHKIDQFGKYIQLNPSEYEKLSQSEKTYLDKHMKIRENLYNAQFLNKFPEFLQKLDDNVGGMNMAPPPDLDDAVFVLIMKDISEPVLLNNGESLMLSRGGIYAIRYSAVQKYVLDGTANLI